MLLTIITAQVEPAYRARFIALFVEYEAAIERLARGYERDPQRRRDLEQEIWMAAFRAFSTFEGRASERTFLYRVAHNVAATHLTRRKRERSREIQGVDADDEPDFLAEDAERSVAGRARLQKLILLIHSLKAADRQLVLLFLEGVERAEIADIMGMTVDNVSVRLSRLRGELARGLAQGEQP